MVCVYIYIGDGARKSIDWNVSDYGNGFWS